jgi:hypothetical protein
MNTNASTIQPRDTRQRFDFKRQTAPDFVFDSPYSGEVLDVSETAGGYFCPVQNSGRIVASQLNVTSYADFGFQHPDAIRETGFSKQDGAETIGEESSHLTPTMADALVDYGESGYENLNAWLRSDQSPALNGPRIEEQCALLDEALERRGVQRIVYRFENKKAADVAHLVLGSEIRHQAYISTSYDPHTSSEQDDEDFDRVIFEIKTSAGVNISNIARFEEAEVVLPRNLRFMVVGIHREATFSARKVQVPFDRGQSLPGTVSVYRSHTIVQMVEIDVGGQIVS